MELIVVVAILCAFFSVVGVVFSHGWRASARLVRQAEHRQADYVLLRLWQDAVRGSEPAHWQISSNGFGYADRLVFQDKSQFVVRNGTAEKRFRLPGRSVCSFAIEKPAGTAPCAVLTVTHEETGASGPARRSAHFVACGGKP